MSSNTFGVDVQADYNRLQIHDQGTVDSIARMLSGTNNSINNSGKTKKQQVPFNPLPNGTPQTQRFVLQSSNNQPHPVPHGCVSNSNLTPNECDMTGTMTDRGKRVLIRDCVKNLLFRRLKFFRKELHGLYSQSQSTVCGLVMKSCNVSMEEATLEWWSQMRKVVIATHTDHRNNVIKTMRLRFRGK
jgi:hypothetical protein